MKTRYLTLLLSLAFLLCFSMNTQAGKPSKPSKPGGGGGATAEYTARLTAGDFVFAAGTIGGLVANNKGTSLPSNGTLEMNLTIDQAGAMYYFGDCSDLIPDGVLGFDVLEGSWWIEYTKERRGPGNIHITMRNLIMHPAPSAAYSGVDFDFDLHGAIADGDTFLPGLNQVVTHTFNEYVLWGGANGQGGFTCNSDGRRDMLNNSQLEITRVN